MIGLKRLIALLLVMFPFIGTAQEIEHVVLDVGTQTVIETTDSVSIGKVESVDVASIVIEDLPPDPVLVLLETAKRENLQRANMKTADLSQTECLATAMYHEARGEGERGLKAVAYVIHNRVKSGLFPDNYCDVVTQKAQFSFVSDRKPDNIKDWDAYTKVLALAVELIENNGFHRLPSPVENALFFHSFRNRSGWAYARTSKFIATIGNHHFFK